MPLQKSHPQLSTENPDLTRKKAFPERRRTLQTVSELSPNETATAYHVQQSKSGNEPHKKRRLRPKSGGFEDAQRMHPTTTVTPTDPVPIRRTPTTPPDRKPEASPSDEKDDSSGSRKTHRRLSWKLPRHRRSSEQGNDAPPDYEDTRKDSNLPSYLRGQGKPHAISAARPDTSGEKIIQTYKPSGARTPLVQESRTADLNEGAPAPNIQRHRRGGSIALGSDTTLPTLSPMPTAKVNTRSARRSGSQQQLLQNSRTIKGPRYSASHQELSRIGLSLSSRYTEDQRDNNQTLQRVSTKSNLALNAQRTSSSRPRSTIPDIQVYPQPALEGLATSLSQGKGDGNTGPPPRYSFPRPPSEAHLRDARTPRPTHRSSQTPIRSTSATSTTTMQTSRSASTARTRGSSPGGRSLSTRSNRSLRHQQHGLGVTKEHLDALAALTAPAPNPPGGMTPESMQFLEQQQRKLDEKIRRQSVASERSARMSLIQEGKKAGSKMSGSGSASGSAHSYSPYSNSSSNRGSLAQSPNQSYRVSMTSVYGPSSCGPGSEGQNSSLPAEALQGLTPESIRLLREREKLVRWKAAREKVEFERREREKIRERVRRANEMEEARSRELEMEKKGKRRGCCGFFG